MTSINSPEYAASLVKTAENINTLNAISGYFFDVILYDSIHVEAFKGVMSIQQKPINDSLNGNVIANLWLDANTRDIDYQSPVKIEIIKEFELLHLLTHEKSYVQQYLPMTCEAKIQGICIADKFNVNSKIKDEFLL